MIKLAFYLLLPITFIVGQTAPPPAAAEAKKMATIEGIVVNETTKEPLRRAEISLQHSGKDGIAMMGGNAAYSAVTDAAGKFRIENIEPGEYFLDHHKAGYVSSRSAFGFSSRSLKLGAAESMKDLRYSLLPQAIVTGRVLDDEGEPVQGASVMLMRSQYHRGSPRMFPGAQAQTNDRGEYRMIGVAPGKYYLQANVQRMMMASAPPAPSATAGEPKTAFVSTYYPNALDTAQATKIEAHAGIELSGQDITLRKEKVVKVSGTALDADGSPAKHSFIMLMQDDGFSFFSNMGSAVDEKGNFTINNVRPGQYTAMLNRMDGQSRQSTQATVTVGDTDLTKVALQMSPGLEAKGVIVLEGSDRKDFDFSNFGIYLNPVGSSPFGGAGTNAKSDGSFTISQLTPGRYNLMVNGGGGDSYVQSIQVGPEDVLGKEVDAATLAAAGIRIVVRLDPAKVTGIIEIPEDRKADLRSPTVVFLPADTRLRASGQFSVAQPDQTNGFELKNVRPGDYLALAFEEFDYASLEDPEVLAAVESKATKITLARGESKQLTLKILPWPAQFAERLQ